ncbi:MAG: hypothetical protein QOC71_1678, partial [Thermoplasmata archaeon]|nr:hypothetical protein [Thermoplasmata archaeon]
TWSDPPAQAPAANGPDTFRLEVQDRQGRGLAAQESANDASGQGRLEMVAPIPEDRYVVILVSLLGAGDSTIGPFPLQADTEDSWRLEAYALVMPTGS